MSEYQYYQFQTIDKPLTPKEQGAIGKISSRVELTAYSAVFVYHYSDLRAEPKQLLAQYFDAMFYIASWATTRIMFRFPRSMVNVESWQPYLIGDQSMSIETIGDSVILDMKSYQEGGGYGWIEDGADHMPPLAQLREDLLNGDLRILYLAWLRGTEQEWLQDTSFLEPPVPAGLKTLTSAQKSFVEAFEIDKALLAAAARTSPSMSDVTPSEHQLKEAIDQLSPAEVTDFMLRLAQDEKGLSMVLRQKLKPYLATPAAHIAPKQRTLDQIRQLTTEEAKLIKRKEAAQREIERLAKLVDLAKREAQMWEDVITFAEKKTGKGYDQATAHLLDLRELAEHQQAVKSFNQRVNDLARICAKRPALIRRWKENNLI